MNTYSRWNKERDRTRSEREEKTCARIWSSNILWAAEETQQPNEGNSSSNKIRCIFLCLVFFGCSCIRRRQRATLICYIVWHCKRQWTILRSYRWEILSVSPFFLNWLSVNHITSWIGITVAFRLCIENEFILWNIAQNWNVVCVI